MTIRIWTIVPRPDRPARRPPRANRTALLLTGVAAGAALALLLDPDERGRRRREHAAARARRSARHLRRRTRTTALRTRGRLHRVEHRLHPQRHVEVLDDVGLAHKVESSVFRDPRVPKGQISVNAEAGTVFLRGAVAGDDLRDMVEELVVHVRGVRDVVNLLHEPGTPAPQHV